MSTCSPHSSRSATGFSATAVAVVVAFLAAVALLFVVTLAAEPASAQAGTTAPEPAAVPAYAVDHGVSESVAYDNLSRLPGLLDSLRQVRTAAGPRTAGWGVDHGQNMTAWVLLTGNDPAVGVEGLAANSGIDVRYGASKNFETLVAVQRALTNDLANRYGDSLASSELDLGANEVDVTLVQDMAPSVGFADSIITPNDLIGDATVAAHQEAAKYGVEVDVKFGDAVTGDALDTGTPLLFTPSNVQGCMTSFGVTFNGSEQGALTANHCDWFNSAGVFIEHIGERQGYEVMAQDGVGDARLLRIPDGETLSARFQSDFGEFRAPTEMADRLDMLGDVVCHFGLRSGFSCGTVTNINHITSGPASFADRPRVRVEGENMSACRGDSGGPWFNGTTAYGTHSASIPNGDDCNEADEYALFTPVSGAIKTFSDFNISLLTDTTTPPTPVPPTPVPPTPVPPTPVPPTPVPPTPVPPSGCVLANGSSQTFSADGGGSIVCKVDVPSGASTLTVNMDGPNATSSNEADLYVNFGGPATVITNGADNVEFANATACTQWVDGNTASCPFTNPAAGTWYVTIADFGNRSFSNISLTANWSTTPIPPTPTSLCGNGATWNVANQNGGGTERCTFTVPAGLSSFTVAMTGPSASTSNEADLYLQQGSAPSPITNGNAFASSTQTTCTVWEDGNDATCTVTNPVAGTWHVLIADYNGSGFSGITTSTSW